MNTLSLVNPEHPNGIRYKVSKFPDGQQSIDIDTSSIHHPYGIVTIISRLNSFMDLELIICANQALKSLNFPVEGVNLYVPYFLGARSDRKFVEGGINYLKQVICPIINSQGFNKVITMDPHSFVLEACVNNFTGLSNISFVDDALSYLIKENEDHKIALISPDAGAIKKIYDVAKHFKITNVTTATKNRDVVTGSILKTEIPLMNLKDIEQIVIIDDIGDGFGTFLGLATEIRKQTDLPINLLVTHTIQEQGLRKALTYYDRVFTTNSTNDWDKIISDLYMKTLFVTDVFNNPK